MRPGPRRPCRRVGEEEDGVRLVGVVAELERLLAGFHLGRLQRLPEHDLDPATPRLAKRSISRRVTKLDLRDRTQAVIAAYESGLVRPGEPDPSG